MRILCVVGTNPYDFSRLVKEVDLLGLDNEVTIQLGSTLYTPQYSKYFEFCSRSEMSLLIRNADVVISHGGFGTISECLDLGKMLLVLPRDKSLGECLDDQSEVVDFFWKKQVIIKLKNEQNLQVAINNAFENIQDLKKYFPAHAPKISTIIESFINNEG